MPAFIRVRTAVLTVLMQAPNERLRPSKPVSHHLKVVRKGLVKLLTGRFKAFCRDLETILNTDFTHLDTGVWDHLWGFNNA